MKEVEHESIVVTTGYAVNAPRTASGNPVVTLRSAAQEAVYKVLTKNLMIKEERQRLHSMRGEWAHSGSFPVARKQISPLAASFIGSQEKRRRRSTVHRPTLRLG